MFDLIAGRLRAQRLIGAPFGGPVEAVRHFGAVQSQDYPAAKWALGLRLRSAVDADIDRAYNEAGILRTHVLRPTWHFVAPEDIRWMLALSGPKILKSVASRYRELELDARTIARAHGVFEKALAGGGSMTRPELGRQLAAARIAPDGQRLPHLLSSGELTGLLTSGPLKGRQVSYALLEERVAKAPVLERDEAIGALTRRYFTSHGPATLRDFAWWSGLTQVEAKRGMALAGDALDRREEAGTEYWFDARTSFSRAGAQAALLLPNFDEYTVGYADRSAIVHPARPFRPEIFAFSSILSNVVVIAGQVCGSWRRVRNRGGFGVDVRQLGELSQAEQKLVDAAIVRYVRFVSSSR